MTLKQRVSRAANYNPRTARIFVPLILLLLLACLCQYNPYAHLFVTEKPKAEDVIGNYVLKEQTLTTGGLEILQDKRARIELHQDNSFNAMAFPIWKNVHAKYELENTMTLTGNWRIQEVGSVSNGSDDLKSVWGIYFSDRVPNASLSGSKSSYGLIFTYGDPDSGRVMIFERAD